MLIQGGSKAWGERHRTLRQFDNNVPHVFVLSYCTVNRTIHARHRTKAHAWTTSSEDWLALYHDHSFNDAALAMARTMRATCA